MNDQNDQTDQRSTTDQNPAGAVEGKARSAAAAFNNPMDARFREVWDRLTREAAEDRHRWDEQVHAFDTQLWPEGAALHVGWQRSIRFLLSQGLTLDDLGEAVLIAWTAAAVRTDAERFRYFVAVGKNMARCRAAEVAEVLAGEEPR